MMELQQRVVKRLLLPWQGEWIRWDDRVAGLIGGLGSGKTMIACGWFIDRVMTYPRATHVVAGRDLPQLKRGTIPSLRAEFEARNIDTDYNKSDSSITVVSTGCRIQMLSAENYASFRSLEADTIFADEISDWSKTSDAFVKYLYPRLRPSPNGKCYDGSDGRPPITPKLRFATNPPGATHHWLYDLLVTKEFCRYLQVSTRDNHILMKADPEYIQGMLRSMSAEEAHILIDGKWGNLTQGRVYRTFRPETHCEVPTHLPPLHLDPNKPLQWSHDFNVGLMCSVICQTHSQQIVKPNFGANGYTMTNEEKRAQMSLIDPRYREKIIYIVDQIRLPDAGVPDVLDAFFEKFGDHARRKGVRLYGDPAGGGRSQQISSKSSARSNWDLIVQRFRAERVPFEFRVASSAPPVIDRTNAVNSQFLNADGQIGMVLSREAARDVLVDLESVKWKEGTNDIDKTVATLTHLTDALGYLVHREKVIAEEKKRTTTIRRGPLSLV